MKVQSFKQVMKKYIKTVFPIVLMLLIFAPLFVEMLQMPSNKESFEKPPDRNFQIYI